MLRNMVTSILKHERIHTTDTKAKVLRGWVDHLITLARRGDLHARRQAMSIVQENAVVHKLFADAKERFGAFSKGGYTRIVKLGHRPGDAAPMSLIELAGTPAGTGRSSGKKAKAEKREAAPAVKAPAITEQPVAPIAEPTEAVQVQDAAAEQNLEAADAPDTPPDPGLPKTDKKEAE